MNEVGVALAVTRDSREYPFLERLAEQGARMAVERQNPGVTGIEIDWLWNEAFTTPDGTDVPAHWTVMATGQMP